MEKCWNCGANASEYLPEYANYFCDGCASIFREELKKYVKKKEP